jgi:hypothetical protein
VNRLVISGVRLQQTRTGEPRSQSLVLVMVVAGMLWLRATGPAGMDACMGGLFRSMHVGMGSVMGLSLLGVVPGTLMKDSPCDRDWHPEARRRLCLWYSIFWEWGNGIKGNGKCRGGKLEMRHVSWGDLRISPGDSSDQRLRPLGRISRISFKTYGRWVFIT